MKAIGSGEILERWTAFVVRRPRTVLIATAVLTLLAGVGVRDLTLRMDGRAMAPGGDPAVLFDRSVREDFGVRDQLVVLVESGSPEGIYDPAFLERLVVITEAAQSLSDPLEGGPLDPPGAPSPGAADAAAETSDEAAGDQRVRPQDVVSLATERRDRVYPGTLRFRPFLDPLPETEQLLDVLREDIAAARVLDGTLVSRDHTAAAVFVGVPDVEAIGDRAPLYRELVERLEPFDDDTVTIRVVGAPAAEALLGHHIMDDMAILLPIAVLSMALLLFLFLGRHWAMQLAMLEVGACLVATFGLMGWCGVPVSLTSGVLPLVLVSLGLADEIHLLTRYQALLDPADPVDREDPASLDPLRRAVHDMIPPILVTSLTTSLGFASFLASPIAPIREFGAFAAFGILYCLVFTLGATPAALVLLGPDRLRAPASRRGRSRLLGPILAAGERPRLALAASLALALGLGAGISRLVVQDGWIDGFAPDSTFRQDTERANDHLLGTHNLLIHLAVEDPGPERDGPPPEGDGRQGWLLDPELLDAIGRYETFLASLDGVGGVLGPHRQLSAVSHLWHARREGSFNIPRDVVKVGRVYRFFDIVRGKHRRREVVSDSLDRALITVFLRDANYQDTQRLVERALDWDEFAGYSVELSIAGDVAVSQAMIPAIVRSQVSSLILALCGALVALVLLLRSARTAILAIAPVATAVVCVFGAMGWLGIPLGVATSMFCAITLGVGVDYAIHLVAARRRAQAAGAPDPCAAAVIDAGPAILIDFLVIALGFAWMTFSQVPSNARLGVLVAVALALSCVFTLVGLRSVWSVTETAHAGS